MFGWFRSLFSATAANAPAGGVSGIPSLNKPLLLFMESPGMAETLRDVPSWEVVHVTTRSDCVRAIETGEFSVFIALSPMDHSGQAGEMIGLFKEKNPDAFTVYHSWTYNLDVTFERALRVGADAAIVGGVTAQSLVFFLGTAILLKRRSGYEPSTLVYRRLLETTCADSPFWQMQNLPCPAGETE